MSSSRRPPPREGRRIAAGVHRGVHGVEHRRRGLGVGGDGAVREPVRGAVRREQRRPVAVRRRRMLRRPAGVVPRRRHQGLGDGAAVHGILAGVVRDGRDGTTTAVRQGRQQGRDLAVGAVGGPDRRGGGRGHHHAHGQRRLLLHLLLPRLLLLQQ